MLEWLKKNVMGSIVVTLLTGILYFLIQIYSVFSTLPEKFSQNEEEHQRIEQLIKEETRLREGRDESLQRQISKQNDIIRDLEIRSARLP